MTVLSRTNLQSNNIIISGHTDRKGTAEYNLKLSERRADAVVDYLANKFPINRANLMAVGYGLDKLKDTANPLAAEKRRVELYGSIWIGQTTRLHNGPLCEVDGEAEP